MNNKKKLIIAGASALGCAAIGFGAYAFFVDDDSFEINTNIGIVDLTVTGNLLHEDAYGESVNILNPGDNDPDCPTDSRDGTDHELSIHFTNNGNKSVLTRALITVKGEDSEGNALSQSELANILIGMNENAHGIGDTITAVDKDNINVLISNDGQSLYYNPDLNVASIVYVVGGTYESPYILSGTGNDAEIELDINGNAYPYTQNLTFEIGLKSDVNSSSSLHGAIINIAVEIQAMQYRNTGSGQWDSLFADSYEVRIPN